MFAVVLVQTVAVVVVLAVVLVGNTLEVVVVLEVEFDRNAAGVVEVVLGLAHCYV